MTTPNSIFYYQVLNQISSDGCSTNRREQEKEALSYYEHLILYFETLSQTFESDANPLEYAEDSEFSADPIHFDHQLLLASGKVSPVGTKIYFYSSQEEHVDAIVMKSDSATLFILEVKFEISPGNPRFASLSDQIAEARSKMENNIAHFPAGKQREDFLAFLTKLQKFELGLIPFTVILDDPLSNSFIDMRESGGSLQKIHYERTWDQNQEYDLTPIQEHSTSLDEAIQELKRLIKISKKIVAFTGAGISTESGIPSYRGFSEDNIWNKFDPSDESIDNFLAKEDVQEVFYTD